MQTNFPYSSKVTIYVEDAKANNENIYVRIPKWLKQDWSVFIDNVDTKLTIEDNGYVKLPSVKKGSIIEFDFIKPKKYFKYKSIYHLLSGEQIVGKMLGY